MRRIPPFQALRAFEATARLGGVKQAAAELCVTQSAISHQIANLEEHLGGPVFNRVGKRLQPTSAGRRYVQKLGALFDGLEEATRDVQALRDREVLSISMPPTFAAQWLAPRLKDFLDTHPDLDIRMIDRLRTDDAYDDIDCAIEYRLRPDPKRNSRLLFPDQIVPIASPELISSRGIHCLDDLKGVPLIETERRLVSWQSLLHDTPWASGNRVISVKYSHLSFRLASLGYGVSLGNLHNAQSLIDEGILAVPFRLSKNLIHPTPRYYFTVIGDAPAKVEAFRQWIFRHCQRRHCQIKLT